MLRRLEKGLNNAKLKSHSYETTLSQLAHDSRLFPDADLPPLNLVPRLESGSHPRPLADGSDHEDDDDDSDKNAEGMFPAQLIKKENQLQRKPFFKTILNPVNTEPHSNQGAQNGSTSSGSPPFASRTPTRSPSASPAHHTSNGSPSEYNGSGSQNGGLKDPIDAGLITEDEAQVFFDMFFLRLNPFINLFDPALHTVTYVRSRCPFLFTTLMMACCKFFKPNLYQAVNKLAHEFSVRAFAESWKRVEVVQAFACLTYWKEADDTRTWTFIGYACRMAIELSLNRFVSESRLPHETDLQWLERRNRERTYLVLFVHDRSLSTMTGRPWMLHEDEIVRHSARWHEQGGGVSPGERRPEDVILASFVQLRLIASETASEIYARNSGEKKDLKEDVNHSELLRQCNFKLNQWMEHWEDEMNKAGGENFHIAFIRLFWLYLRLFLNSFGVQRAMASPPSSQPPVNIDALQMCFRSAVEHLQSVVDDFAAMSTLRYGQETITVMTAYCSVFLLKLLRNPNTSPHLPPNAVGDVHKYVLRTAEAHDSGSSDTSSASSSAEHHARFLRGLIIIDIHHENREKERLTGKREASADMTSSANVGPGSSSYPGPDERVPMDQYPSSYPQVPSQISHPDAYYSSPPSAATASPTNPPHADMPRVPASHYSDYAVGNGAIYYSDPPAPSMALPPHPPSHQLNTNALASGYTQSDVAYSQMMFRSIGIGYDLYHPTNPQQQYGQVRPTQAQQGWTMGDNMAYGSGSGYPNANGGDYVYHNQRGYDGYQR
ncbi:hypothetical protein EUX98_g6558 [Antrodiella citrinella]|uniref:Xylanolytic transcriptional activator regulatory domain-containing protein n=1 Tax=Antrodiella citrinella TaxID=2447956 RepID=A0A4V3XI31_9APHY|nr:hypothetical protein EUX98_g6558 [Antrodiella citrinella]